MAFATLAGGGPGGFPSRVAKSRAWKKWNLHQLGPSLANWGPKSAEGCWKSLATGPVACRICSSPHRTSPAKALQMMIVMLLLVLLCLIHICHHSVTLYHFPNILQQETAATLLGASIPTFRLPICALCKKTSLAVGTAAVFGCTKKLLFLSASAVTLSN